MSIRADVPERGRRPKRIRQADVAQAAGVSQATVSLVLSKSPDLSITPETRQAVLDAARELGYVPDPIAQRLASGRNFLLGLHTFAQAFPVNLSNSYYPYLEGVEEEAAAQGFDLLLFTGSTARNGSENGMYRLRLADGCILVGRHPQMADMRDLLDSGYPLVYIGRHDELGDQLSYVGADYANATEELVDRLWGMGHRNFVYLQELDTAIASTDREAGFLRAIAKRGSAATAEPVRMAHTEITPALVREWVDAGVTAIMVEGGTESPLALSATTRALAALGLQCPRDLSLAATGAELNRRVDELVITGFEVPRGEMGRQAVRLLIEMLTGADLPVSERQRLLRCVPLEGDTSGPVPVR